MSSRPNGVGTTPQVVDEYKLWYSRGERNRKGVAIIVDSDLREQVVEVRRVKDKMVAIKLVVGGSTLNIIST